MVGAGKKEFKVLQSVATKSSKFMQKALNGNWKESGDRRVSLPETKVSDFEIYLEWLYTDDIVTLDGPGLKGMTLVRSYLLGDFLGDDRYSNAVIDAFIRDSVESDEFDRIEFWAAGVDIIWATTLPGCTLRKLLVDFAARQTIGDTRTPVFLDRGTWSRDVTAEILARMCESTQVAVEMLSYNKDTKKINKAIESAVEHPKDNKDKCAYHRHGEGYPRCA